MILLICNVTQNLLISERKFESCGEILPSLDNAVLVKTTVGSSRAVRLNNSSNELKCGRFVKKLPLSIGF